MIFLGSTLSFAQVQKNTKAAAQTTKLGFIQENFSGANNKSFAQGKPAYGLELSTDNGGTFLRYFIKGRLSYSEGNQSFLNGATTFASDYKFYEFAPEIGISFYPVSRRDKGSNMYLWGLGNISYNYLALSTLPSGSTLQSKSQSFGTGYGAGIGFELIVGDTSRGGTKTQLYIEVGFRDESTNIINVSSFAVSGMTFSGGIGF